MFSQIAKHMAGPITKLMYKETAYDRSGFAKSVSGIFGKSLGNSINQYWNNVLYKSWNKWNMNDFSTAGKALGPSITGYSLGGLGTSSPNHIRWNEKSARAGGFLGGAIGFALGAWFFGAGFMSGKYLANWYWTPIIKGSLANGMVVNGGLITISMTGSQAIGLVGIGASLATQDALGLSWTALGMTFPKYPMSLFPLSASISLTEGVIRTYNAML